MKPILVWVLVSCLFSFHVHAEKRDNYRDVYQFTWENDIASGDDGGYTNGFALGYAKGPMDQFDDDIPSWIAFLASPFSLYDDPNYDRADSHIFGQTMQTADDIEEKALQPNDLPYAGLLFWQGRLHFYNLDRAHEMRLTLGVVGKLSGAEQLQKGVHSITGSDEPEGWDNQLNNEAVINLGYSTRWDIFHHDTGTVEFDIVPTLGAEAGNLESGVGAGINFRVGSQLKSSFVTSSILSGRKPDPLAGNVKGSWYFSIGASAEYMFNELLVEGNTWENSHGLSLKHDQYAIGVAAGYSFGDVALIWNYVSETEKADELDGNEEFGSLSIAWAYND